MLIAARIVVESATFQADLPRKNDLVRQFHLPLSALQRSEVYFHGEAPAVSADPEAACPV